MRAAVLVLGAAIGLPALAAAPVPKPEGATVTTLDAGTIAEIRATGAFVSVALPRLAGRGREILLLVEVDPRETADPKKKKDEPCGRSPYVDRAAAAAKPLRLLRWSPAAPATLDALREDLDRGFHGLDAVDLDGDGSDELVLYRSGGAEALARGPDGRFAGPPRPLFADPSLEFRGRARLFDSALLDGEVRLRHAVEGTLRTYGPGASGAEWGERSSVPIPTESRARGEALVVETPEVVPVGRIADGTVVFATAPEEVGTERIRFWRLTPEAAEDSRAVECWCALPGPERMIDWAYDILGGRPVLIVTTTRGDKMSLLGEKKLRVFPMEPDRTRRGVAPIAAFPSELNLWQMTEPSVRDVDGDGTPDLVLPYWKGLKNDIAAVTVHPGRSDAGIAAKGVTQSFDIEKGDRAFIRYGPDLDADGNPELLLFGGEMLRVFPGLPAARRPKALVAEKPRWSFPIPKDVTATGGAGAQFGSGGFSAWRSAGPMGRLLDVDLDGSGGTELILAGSAGSGQACVLVFATGSLR